MKEPMTVSNLVGVIYREMIAFDLSPKDPKEIMAFDRRLRMVAKAALKNDYRLIPEPSKRYHQRMAETVNKAFPWKLRHLHVVRGCPDA